MTDVTQILLAVREGDTRAAEALLPLLYDELRKLAASLMAKEKPGQTLQATALVHEAYLRLVKPDEGSDWQNRGHFFAAAAEAMRRILIDKAREKAALKRGGDRPRLDIEDFDIVVSVPLDSLLELDEALQRLEEESQKTAEVVKLRWFAGMSIGEIAALLEVSRTTASRHWAYARAWLSDFLDDNGPRRDGATE